MKIIEVIVSPTGETRVETKGFVGAECQQASMFIEQSLGERAGECLTSEFHLVSQEQNKQRVQGGGFV